MALYATVYVALMGKNGLKEVNRLSCDGAHYLYDKLIATGKFKDPFRKPFLKEFTLSTDLEIKALNRRLAEKGFMGGIDMEGGLVSFAVTEKRTKEEIDQFVKEIIEA